jgi:hypothetical protein
MDCHAIVQTILRGLESAVSKTNFTSVAKVLQQILKKQYCQYRFMAAHSNMEICQFSHGHLPKYSETSICLSRMYCYPWAIALCPPKNPILYTF